MLLITVMTLVVVVVVVVVMVVVVVVVVVVLMMKIMINYYKPFMKFRTAAQISRSTSLLNIIIFKWSHPCCVCSN
jgi:hypothetical protein